MREIRINIHQPENVVVVNEKNQKNVSIVNNIFMKSETKRNEPDVDINDYPWLVIFGYQRSRESKPT